MTKKILVIEDDSSVAGLLEDLLSAEGFDVVVERDGEWGLRAFEERGGADLVLLDILLPKVQGFDLIPRLRLLPGGDSVPLLVMSGVFRSATYRDQLARRHDVRAYFDKPLDTEALLAELRSIFGDEYPEAPSAGPRRPRAETTTAASPSAPVEVPDKGDLEEVPFARLLGLCFRGRITGALMLRHAAIKKIVYFKEGVPVFVRSNLLDECLGRIMVEERLITQKECERSLELKRKSSGKRQGELLVKMGSISQHNLQFALELQMQMKLFEVFSWQDGSWQLNPQGDYTGPQVALSMSPAALIHEGAGRAMSTERIRRDLATATDRPLLPSADPTFRYQAQQLDSASDALLDLIDGTRSAATLLDSDVMPAQDAALLVYALFCSGLLHAPGPPPAMPSRVDEDDLQVLGTDEIHVVDALAVMDPELAAQHPGSPTEAGKARARAILEATTGATPDGDLHEAPTPAPVVADAPEPDDDEAEADRGDAEAVALEAAPARGAPPPVPVDDDEDDGAATNAPVAARSTPPPVPLDDEREDEARSGPPPVPTDDDATSTSSPPPPPVPVDDVVESAVAHKATAPARRLPPPVPVDDEAPEAPADAPEASPSTPAEAEDDPEDIAVVEPEPAASPVGLAGEEDLAIHAADHEDAPVDDAVRAATETETDAADETAIDVAEETSAAAEAETDASDDDPPAEAEPAETAAAKYDARRAALPRPTPPPPPPPEGPGALGGLTDDLEIDAPPAVTSPSSDIPSSPRPAPRMSSLPRTSTWSDAPSAAAAGSDGLSEELRRQVRARLEAQAARLASQAPSPQRPLRPERTPRRAGLGIDLEQERARIGEELRATVEALEAQDHYARLELNPGASVEEVEQAHERIARRLQPSRVMAGLTAPDLRLLAERRVLLVRRAYRTLADPEARARYHTELGLTPTPDDAALIAADDAYEQGQAALNEDRFEDAMTAFARAAQRDPEEAVYVSSMAWATYAQAPEDEDGRERALELLRRAAELNPRHEEVYLYAGRIQRQIGRDEAALQAFQRALRCNPDCLEALSAVRELQPEAPKRGGLLSRFGAR